MKKRRTSSNSSAAAGAGAGGAGISMRKAAAPLLLLALTGLSAVPAAEGVKVIRPAQTSDQRFPPDAFAHPAFRVAWLDREPLRNATAHALLFGTPDERDGLSLLQQQQQQEHKPAMGGRHEHAHGQQHTQHQQGGQKMYSALGAPLSRPLDNESHSLELHFLDEDSPYLCAIPRINSTADKYRASPEAHPTSALEVLQQALVLLDPLKSPIAAKPPSGSSLHNPASFSSNCLYHTFDWFTYAYCHGRSITQFRALPQTIGSAAELASALAESAKDGKGQTIVKRIEPRKDPQWPAFVLGRWSSDIERLLDDEGTLLLVGAQDSGTVSQHDLVSKSAQERKSAHSSSGSESGHQQLGSIVSVSSVDPKRAHIHTALIEVVAFDDPAVQHVAAEKDKDGARFLRAAEAAAKRAAAAASRSGGSASSSDLSASSSTTNTALGKSERPPAIAQRYISQTWSDGTPCVDTGEPREIEVQYHCVPSAGLHPVDRISMVRETTVVIVIETSRLCSVPALAVGRRSTTAYGVGDDAHSIDCRPIVRDDWDGDAALRDLEEERKRREEEEMAALRKRIQAQGGLTLRSPVGTAESSSSTAAAADKRGAVGGSATGKGGAGSSDSAYPGEQVGTAERRKQAEDRIVQALSDALSEYFGLDPRQTKDFLQPRDRDQEQGAESGGSHEEYYDSTGSEHAEGDVGGKGENAPADDRLDKLTDMVNRAMGDLGDAADGGGAIKLLELRVGEDGVIRSATLSAPTGAASGAAAAATATHTGTADEEAAGDDKYIDALFDELGLTDWLAGELEERAGRKDEVFSGGAIGDGSRAQRQEGGASAAGAQQVSGTAGKRKSDEEEAAAPEEEEEEEEGEEEQQQQQQQQSRAETEQTGSSSSRAPGARQHDEL
ncbi:Protein OS-9 [Tilletia horrida]|uniref:Protein OS-9 homolog n=1 Tax=Tilletia horrida TaxID=155126 RepID=A0AAN6G9R7_9BASI|nr:Protein OS-9 [Tilletia horrida]